MNRALALQIVVFVAVRLTAQVAGPTNIRFDEGDAGTFPRGWSVTQSAVDAGELAEIRREGCHLRPNCVAARRNLFQKFDGEKYRGRTIFFSGWLRVDSVNSNTFARLRIISELQNQEKRVHDSPGTSVRPGPWTHVEVVSDIESEIRTISIGVTLVGKGEVWVDSLSFGVVPAPTALNPPQIPSAIRAVYDRMDAEFSSGDYSGLAAHFLPGTSSPRASERLSDQDRVGLLRMLGGASIHMSSTTRLASVSGMLDDYADVSAHTRFTRSSDRGQHYVYEVVWRDLWFLSNGEWRLKPARLMSIEDVTSRKLATPRGEPAVLPPCGLKSTVLGGRFGLGPTNYTDRLRPTGVLTTVMIFVDFPDAPGGASSTEALYHIIVPEAQRWIDRVSNGTARLAVRVVTGWTRVGANSSTYSIKDGTKARTYIRDVVSSLAGRVELHESDIVLIVPSKRTHGVLGTTGTLNAPPGTGVRFGSGELRYVITFGDDLYDEQLYSGPRSNILLHEMGHLFGVPDLYGRGDGIGAWDLMSWTLGGATHPTAWNMAKFGWIKESQVECVASKAETQTLSPVETPDGLKALVLPIGTSKAYVIEAREFAGVDAGGCGEGVLVYSVDTSDSWAVTYPNESPMKLAGPKPSEGICPGSNALLNLDPDHPSVFEDPDAGVTVTVEKVTLGAFTVSVHRTLSAR